MSRKLPIILAVIALRSCALETSIPFCEVAIFNEAEYIWVPAYTYTDPYTQKEYLFHGTSSDTLTSIIDDGTYETTTVIPYEHYDTVSSRPPFIWRKTKSNYVMVAIFNERIAMDQQKNQIANPEAMVWAWNTGMLTGQEGAIGYEDGCSVIQGVIQYGTRPDPLVNGQSYVLAIWAWDNDASVVRYSSREIPFTIEEL
jgi:hypothetical protein